MICKDIKYTDFDGVEQTEKFWFNLSEAEALEFEVLKTQGGGLKKWLEKMKDENDRPGMVQAIVDMITASYGEKSLDGRYFNKTDADGRRLEIRFKGHAAYNVLLTELATDADKLTEFFHGITPTGFMKKEISEQKKQEMTAEIVQMNNQTLSR